MDIIFGAVITCILLAIVIIIHIVSSDDRTKDNNR